MSKLYLLLLSQVLQLSLLVGIKDVGDSVRRLMIKMFSDEVLTLYSLLGFKKKNNFSKLECYNLLIGKLLVLYYCTIKIISL